MKEKKKELHPLIHHHVNALIKEAKLLFASRNARLRTIFTFAVAFFAFTQLLALSKSVAIWSDTTTTSAGSLQPTQQQQQQPLQPDAPLLISSGGSSATDLSQHTRKMVEEKAPSDNQGAEQDPPSANPPPKKRRGGRKLKNKNSPQTSSVAVQEVPAEATTPSPTLSPSEVPELIANEDGEEKVEELAKQDEEETKEEEEVVVLTKRGKKQKKTQGLPPQQTSAALQKGQEVPAEENTPLSTLSPLEAPETRAKEEEKTTVEAKEEEDKRKEKSPTLNEEAEQEPPKANPPTKKKKGKRKKIPRGLPPIETLQSHAEPPSTSNTSSQNEGKVFDNEGNVFEGSKITRLSDGMDLYENVCLYSKGEGHTPTVRSYTADAGKLYHTNYNQLRVGNEVFMIHTEGHKLEEWAIDSTTNPSKYTNNTAETPVLIEEETLWTLTLHMNPAHGLTDGIFSFILDRYQRSTQQDGPYYNMHSLVNNEDKDPYYRRYLIGKFKGYEPPTYRRNFGYGWQYEMMGVLGLIQPGPKSEGGTAIQGHYPLTCFKKLLVPTLHMQRYPVNSIEDPKGYQLFREFSEMGAPYHTYPQAALRDMHQRALQNMGFPHEPWPQDDDEEDDKGVVKDKPILIHVRAKSQRRKLLNALELKTIMERQYHVNVTIVQEDWLKYSFTQQAQTYNQYPYIITAHGAHLANAVFMRPKTKVLEIFCNKYSVDLNPNINLTTWDQTTTSHKDWWGGSYASWFETFTRRLDVDHFEYGAENGVHCAGGVKKSHASDIRIDIPKVLPLIVNRFHLVPRQQQQQMQKREDDDTNTNAVKLLAAAAEDAKVSPTTTADLGDTANATDAPAQAADDAKVSPTTTADLGDTANATDAPAQAISALDDPVPEQPIKRKKGRGKKEKKNKKLQATETQAENGEDVAPSDKSAVHDAAIITPDDTAAKEE